MSHFVTIGERGSAAVLVLMCGLVGGLLAGCSSGGSQTRKEEPDISQEKLESGLEEAEQTLAEDTTETDAYMEKARLLRLKADSTTPTDRYIELHQEAWAGEETAISLDDDVREDVQERRRVVYDREMRRGESAYNRANKYEKEALYRQAIGYFGAAGATIQDSAGAKLHEAYARLQVGERSEVIPVLEQYVERSDRGKKDAYKILGRLYLDEGQAKRAVSLLDEAVRIHPSASDLQSLRLNAYNRAGDVDEALAAYREQVERTPNQAEYRYNYGALLLKARRYDAAVEQLQAAIEQRGDNADGQYNLGAAYLNAALARDDSITTIEENPEAFEDSTGGPDQKIERLRQRRQTLLRKAIPPLERARRIVEEREILNRKGDDLLRRDACRALLVAYVRTNRPNKAATVEECTDFAQMGRR